MMMRSIVIRPLASAVRSSPGLRASKIRPLMLPKVINTRLAIVQLPFSQRALFTASSDRRMNMKEQLKKERDDHLQQKLPKSSTNSTGSNMQNFDANPQNANLEPDMLKGIKSELKIVKETFALDDVPKEVFWIGMAGLTPYVVTSFSTLYLAWDIYYATEHGVGYIVSKETAINLLQILEPTQIGLGAIILSFLGAVHWGLEMAEYGGKHPYRRYTLAILAPVLAWPTVLLPLDYALLAQFVGFVGIYFADTNATSYGWAPKWYSMYRFLLTFVVGACIIMTLIGRGEIGDSIKYSEGAIKHLEDIRNSQREYVRQEEEFKRRKLAENKKVQQEGKKHDEDGQDTDTQQNASNDAKGGQPAEPSGEKNGLQKPQPERPQSTAMRG